MKNCVLRGLVVSLVIGMAALGVEAQRRPVEPDHDDDVVIGNTCVGKGANCIFGGYSDCWATCYSPSAPSCSPGGCFLGFPLAPECGCVGGTP